MFSLRFAFAILAIVFLFCRSTDCVVLFDWLFGRTDSSSSSSSSQDDPHNSMAVADGQAKSNHISKIAFELNVADERFLAEAAKFTDHRLSQLDTCHQKIILALSKSCVHLSEEEISKLSVNLLNCQSEVEGREIYACTSDMTLRDCTRNMNSNTWNAYLIISNRARAVCYGTRQVQFRTKTEMTINKLIATAEQQAVSMSELQGEQEKLGVLTQDTLKTISSGHDNILQQQVTLMNAQQNIQTYVASNLRDLTREKTLILSGQKDLAEMKRSIKENIEVAKTQLAIHQEDREQSHLKIVNDISEIHAKTKILFEKIDNSTEKILKQHEAVELYYQESLRNLQRVNASINYLLHLKDDIDGKLNWFVDLIRGTGVRMSVITTVLQHSTYLFFGAVVTAFVNAPLLTRFTLLAIVPLNAFAEIHGANYYPALDFTCLTFVIVASTILNYTFTIIHRAMWRSNCVYRKSFAVNHIDGEQEEILHQSAFRRYIRRSERAKYSTRTDESSLSKSKGIAILPTSRIVYATVDYVRKIVYSVLGKDKTPVVRRQNIKEESLATICDWGNVNDQSDSSSCDNYRALSPLRPKVGGRSRTEHAMIRRSSRSRSIQKE